MFIEQKFSIAEISGISKKTIEEHLKLYAGYVKNTNLILEKIDEYSKEPDKNTYAISEIQRRFSFEFNGMRNHEYYFEQLEGEQKKLNEEGSLSKQLSKDFGSFITWLEKFRSLCLTRGIGWAILYYDKKTNRLINAWIDEQHLGQLNGLDFIYGIDMWEHSYLIDYVPSDKKKYIENYISATNYSVLEKRFEEATK
ncbi:MAG: Fe-Mn family superoxide dismutase [bacterium]